MEDYARILLNGILSKFRVTEFCPVDGIPRNTKFRAGIIRNSKTNCDGIPVGNSGEIPLDTLIPTGLFSFFLLDI